MPFKFNTLLDDAGVSPWDCALVWQVDGNSAMSPSITGCGVVGTLARQPADQRNILQRPYWATFGGRPGDISFAGLFRAELTPTIGKPALNSASSNDPPIEIDRYELTSVTDLDHLRGRVWVEWVSGSQAQELHIDRADRSNKTLTKYIP